VSRLVYRADAKRDLQAIFRYITRESGDANVGKAFVEALQRQCRHLAGPPGILGRARPELAPNLRSFAFHNYVILFHYERDRFEVVSVIEGHRDIDAHFRSGHSE
jgi:plasmid stabilization system protein ParE